MDSCAISFYMFKLGDKHSVVASLKRFLQTRPYLKTRFKLTRSAEFDAAMQAALAEFQQYKKLSVTDGTFNKQTYAALGAEMTKAQIITLSSGGHPVLKYLLLAEAKEATHPDVTKPSRVETSNGNAEDERTDRELAKLLTDSGIVRAASVGSRNVRNADTHFKLRDGKVYTIHIYGDDCANTKAGLYLPQGFDKPKYEGGQGIVSAVHSTTKRVLGFAHVDVTSQAELDRNYSSGKKNAAQSTYIGKLGGAGGDTAAYVHTHIHYFPSAAARQRIKALKSIGDGMNDPNLDASKDLLDVRDLLRN